MTIKLRSTHTSTQLSDRWTETKKKMDGKTHFNDFHWTSLLQWTIKLNVQCARLSLSFSWCTILTLYLAVPEMVDTTKNKYAIEHYCVLNTRMLKDALSSSHTLFRLNKKKRDWKLWPVASWWEHFFVTVNSKFPIRFII